jgi:hypothetical protein
MDDEHVELVKATARRVRRLETALKEAKGTHLAAALHALREGVPPTTVADLSTFSDAYLRVQAREADIPPAVRRRRRASAD